MQTDLEDMSALTAEMVRVLENIDSSADQHLISDVDGEGEY
jgi:hypothetical protein